MEDFTTNYIEKKKAGRIELEFAPENNIATVERGFDPVSGVPMLNQTQVTNSRHISDLIAEDETALETAKAQVAAVQARLADKQALLKDVGEKEKDREKAEAKGGKK